MKLRFEIDQAYLFRKGIDAPKSIVHIEVDPSKLSQDQRNLIADRLIGIDVFKLDPSKKDGLIKAKGSTWADLMEAVVEDENNRTTHPPKPSE